MAAHNSQEDRPAGQDGPGDAQASTESDQQRVRHNAPGEEASRSLADRHLWDIRPLRDLLIIAIVALVLWLGYAFQDITVPLLVALLLAYLFEPVIDWMARTRWIPFGRTGAVSLLLATIIVAVLGTAAVVVPQVVEQTVGVVTAIDDGTARRKLTKLTQLYVPDRLQDEVQDIVNELPKGLPLTDTQDEALPVGNDQSSTPANVNTTASGATDTSTQALDMDVQAADRAATISLSDRLAAQSKNTDLLGLAGRTSRIAMSVLSNTFSIGLLVFLIPFYFFFFSLWYPKVSDFVDSMIPARNRTVVQPLLVKFDRAIAGFVRGRLFIAFIMGVLFAIGWGFAGVPYAILLSLITAVLCLIPFVSGITLPIAIGLLAAAELDLPEAQQMSWLAIILWPTLVFGVIQLLDGWVLQPIIYGKTTDLDPVTIFVAILAGGSVLGIYGMLIAIPVAACVKILMVDLVIPKLRELGSRTGDDPKHS